VRVNLRDRPQQPREPFELSWDDPTEEALEWLGKAKSWEAIEVVPHDRIGENGELIHNLVSESKQGRLCSNTKDLNMIASKLSIKMPSLKDVCQIIPEGVWLAKLDLSKFYWSTLIHPSHRRYFRFRIDGELHQWRALPFGYINSMQIMARILDPVIARIRLMGVEVTSWVDDILLILDPIYEEAQRKLKAVVALLESLGFIVNQEKSSREPSMEVTFRGFRWNSQDLKIRIPSEKIAEWNSLAGKILQRGEASATTLSSLVGKIRYSAQLNPFLISWLVESHIHITMLVKSHGWHTAVIIPELVREELLHWRSRTDTLPWPMRWSLLEALITKGDAGPVGYGIEGPWEIAGLWTPSQAAQSSNWRELTTWRMQIIEFAEHLSSRLSIYETDSVTCAAYVKRVYGHAEALARIAADTFKFMEEKKIYQLPRIVSQEDIHSSDVLSRLASIYDLMLDQEEFYRIQAKFRVVCTVDVFASRFSAKIQRFYSRERDSRAIGMNSLMHSWSQETVYAFPPRNLILRTIMKVREEGCCAILITPEVAPTSWLNTLRRLAAKSMQIPSEKVLDIYGNPVDGSPWRAWMIHSQP
jgi:hypothetical protein